MSGARCRALRKKFKEIFGVAPLRDNVPSEWRRVKTAFKNARRRPRGMTAEQLEHWPVQR